MEQMLQPLAIVSTDYEAADEPAGPQGLKSYPRSWTASAPEPGDAAEPEGEGDISF
jgi:hypothetical protein